MMGIIIGGSKNGLIIKKNERLQVVGIAINNSCNLKCEHCYLPLNQEDSPVLRKDEWLYLTKSLFANIQPSIIAIVGKEPLFNSHSVQLISDIIRLRNAIQHNFPNRTMIGLLTNGMSLLLHSDIILKNLPDYIDISVDGLPEDHDILRGNGAFSNLKPSLKWATKHFPNPLWLTPTLNRNNIDSFLEIVQYYNNNYNIQRFAFGFYIPENNTNETLSLLHGQIEQLVNETLYRLADLKICSPVEILFDLYPQHSESLKCFIDSEWVSSNKKIDSFIYKFSNGITLKIHTTKVAVGLRNSVRITPEGYWLAAEDAIYADNYQQLSVANVRDFHYDAVELYKVGINSVHFQKLSKQYHGKLEKTSLFTVDKNVALV